MDRPKIEIDKDAIRFYHVGGTVNLFWKDLFSPPPYCRDFQHEVMSMLHILHNECVKLNIEPEIEKEKDVIKDYIKDYF